MAQQKYTLTLHFCFAGNLANSLDHEEIPNPAASHLGHHCLSKYPF